MTLQQVENWLRNGRKLTPPLTFMEEVMLQLRDTIIENERLWACMENVLKYTPPSNLKDWGIYDAFEKRNHIGFE